jgi:hypothetical protein
LLAGIAYVAVPVFYFGYMIFFGPGLACGNNCDNWGPSEDYFYFAALAAYVLIMGCGVWWVMKGVEE